MKQNFIVTKGLTLILGMLLIVGPITFMRVCESADKVMKCSYSGRIEIACGILITIMSLAELISEQTDWKFNLMNILMGVFSFSVPSFIIGGCMKKKMKCQMITFPCVYVIAGLIIIVNIVALIKNLKNIRK